MFHRYFLYISLNIKINLKIAKKKKKIYLPTFEMQTVPSWISLLATLAASADLLNLFNSSYICKMLRF